MNFDRAKPLAAAVACLLAFVFSAVAAENTLTRFYAWPPPPDHPHANGTDYWDWQPADRDATADRAPLLDLRSLNETVAGQHGWVTRHGDKLLLGNGTPVRFWAVNTTGNAPLSELEKLAADLARRGVNMIRIHGGASKSLLCCARPATAALFRRPTGTPPIRPFSSTSNTKPTARAASSIVTPTSPP